MWAGARLTKVWINTFHSEEGCEVYGGMVSGFEFCGWGAGVKVKRLYAHTHTHKILHNTVQHEVHLQNSFGIVQE